MNNPYEVLGVDQNAPMKDIVKAMTMALARRKYPTNVIAAARVQLSTPDKRLASDFTFPILEKIGTVKLIPVNESEDLDVSSFDPNKYNSL
jgi:hypothetical protein